jgi:hypothetical protein
LNLPRARTEALQPRLGGDLPGWQHPSPRHAPGCR